MAFTTGSAKVQARPGAVNVNRRDFPMNRVLWWS